MDSIVAAAGRALAAGDPFLALNHVALRDDPPALALRGIAMAQLGDFERARALLQRAATAFGPREIAARARCIVAEAEVALAARDVGWPAKTLDAAAMTLDAHGDAINAAHARLIDIRRLLLLGRLEQAQRGLDELVPAALPPMLAAVHALLTAGIATRRLQAGDARRALGRARETARLAGIPALSAEIDNAAAQLDAPAARQLAAGCEQVLSLDEVEQLLASDRLIVDACRYAVRRGTTVISFATRPLLFSLLRALAEAWPADVERAVLIERIFRTRHGDESHRARLRVEMGRLRALLRPLADIVATANGFALAIAADADVVVLAHPVEERHAAVLAVLADGESWSSSALALVLGISQRSVQRALDELEGAGKVSAVGRGRSRRWMTPPLCGFATTLLLPLPLPGH